SAAAVPPTARSCRRRSARSAIVPAASPKSKNESIRAAKTMPTANSKPAPASSASHAVATRSIHWAPAAASVEHQSQQKAGKASGAVSGQSVLRDALAHDRPQHVVAAVAAEQHVGGVLLVRGRE